MGQKQTVIAFNKFIISLILLISFEDSLDNLDAFQQMHLQFFISMLPELGIQLTSQGIGLTVIRCMIVDFAYCQYQLSIVLVVFQFAVIYKFFGFEQKREGILVIFVQSVDFSDQIIVSPHPLIIAIIENLLKLQRLSRVTQGFGVEVRLIHIVLGQSMMHFDKKRMLLTQPSMARVCYKIYWTINILRFVLDKPLYLSEVALVSKFTG